MTWVNQLFYRPADKDPVDSHNAKNNKITDMSQRVQISCINKEDRYNPYERIQHVGGMHSGKRWRLSVRDAIEGIEQKKYSFYTHVNGHTRNVIVATRNGVKYLKTEADYDTPDNLLSLPECP